MQCPIDGETLIIADRSGVEIDYCPKCRGVWLDRGELDKIIDRIAPELAPAPVDPDFYNAEPHRPDQYGDQYRETRQNSDYRKSSKRPKRRKSFAQNILEELFDFD